MPVKCNTCSDNNVAADIRALCSPRASSNVMNEMNSGFVVKHTVFNTVFSKLDILATIHTSGILSMALCVIKRVFCMKTIRKKS